jgi:hypothetical protein
VGHRHRVSLAQPGNDNTQRVDLVRGEETGELKIEPTLQLALIGQRLRRDESSPHTGRKHGGGGKFRVVESDIRERTRRPSDDLDGNACF